MHPQYVPSLSIDEVVTHIVELNASLAKFWSDCRGWAPVDVVETLREARLDRQLSLSECPRYWAVSPSECVLSDGQLILAWTNLGSLIEGTLKLFLSVYSDDYKASVHACKERKGTKKGQIAEPGTLTIQPLRDFCNKTEQWGKHGTPDWDPFLESVQYRRNAIHGFNSRDVGDIQQLVDAIRNYLEFAHDIAGRLPYPDEIGFHWQDWGGVTWRFNFEMKLALRELRHG